MKRQSESPLLLLAVIGIILYLTVVGSSYLQDPGKSVESEPRYPSITKQEAADAAAQFVKERFGLSAGSYTTNTLFQSNSKRSGYLQKEKLSEEYTKRFSSLPIDYYEVEINDNTNKMTYYIDVNYSNQRILGWEAYSAPSARQQTIASPKPGNQELAELAIKDQGYSVADFVKAAHDQGKKAAERRERPSSAAGTEFVFESKDKQIGTAKLLLTLSVANGKVVSFHPVFDIPQSFLEWQKHQDDRATLMTRISLAVSLIMAFASLYIIIRYRKEITFRRGLLLSFLFLAVYVANNFNMLPAFRTSHSDAPSQLQGIIYLWISNVIIFLMAVSVYFSLLAGKNMWLRRGWNPIVEWSDPTFGNRIVTAMGRGYLLCLFVLGVQQGLFFIAGEYFDVWSVNDPSDSVLNMSIPAIFPLLAWSASISEEAIYRLFGIAFFLKLVRNRFLAVLLPSMIWALSHTQYPIYPVYTRLIEVTIIGLIFGFAFLKYGFMTVLFAHATMDSILMGLSLIDMGDWAQSIIGTFYLIFPAIIGWFLAWVHGKRKRREQMVPS
ncbi:CPBP family intramembrane glutamic endopeptidase [Paenibacillus radicis (ex Xue et al. 2023)]|uniref:CPBP family intramembrane metalloprotease n=1 Tax=Paenibacillus radicis (ex Xue et al. 2023) TaxID=2972489 RepID=A0ABT1YD34_9BACL|nr:type II CAAX endopeptidase family protein [Paenibacillus radicis (ex Xue et al. 2023)]MCR8629865.1 CPBP family intramembrane metalloprotease [Paenibacillus radicis (ex Xue et al. 2023)]